MFEHVHVVVMNAAMNIAMRVAMYVVVVVVAGGGGGVPTVWEVRSSTGRKPRQ